MFFKGREYLLFFVQLLSKIARTYINKDKIKSPKNSVFSRLKGIL